MTDRLLVDPNNPLCIQLDDGKELPWDWIDAERGVASEDDVREIVRRWNCHEHMLDALRLADAALSGANMNMSVVERKVRAAISKAEGRNND